MGRNLGFIFGRGNEERDDFSQTIEKLSKDSGEWEMVATIEERLSPHNANLCSAAAMGSTIYLFENGLGHTTTLQNTTWNSFNVLTGEWASSSTPAENRQLPQDDAAICLAITVPACLDNGKRITWDK